MRTHRFAGPALVAALALLAAASPAAAQRVEVGIAASVVGDVRMSNPATPKARKIARKQRLAWGDFVQTRKKSQLHMLLLDRSNFSLGANTQLVIDRFVYDPGKERSLFARVVKGAFRFFSGEETENASARIDSPVGTIGIRGTALDGIVGEEAVEIARDEPAVGRAIEHDKDNATLVVLRGPGAATEGGLAVGYAEVSAAGKTVVLNQPGLAAYIPRQGAQPIGPFRISPKGLGQVQEQLAPSVANAGGGGGLLGKLLPAAAIGIGAALLLGGGDDDDGGGVQTRPQGTGNNDQTRPQDTGSNNQRPPVQ